MNIHEHQAKEILREFGVPVPNGFAISDLKKINDYFKTLNGTKLVLKAQIHAGGRGKAGGVKIVNGIEELIKEAKLMMGKILVTHQTGPEGKEVKRLYIEEASDIEKEFYLSCLVDRETSKIAFISSTEGGMDIEKVAAEEPNKIITTRINLDKDIIELEKLIIEFDNTKFLLNIELKNYSNKIDRLNIFTNKLKEIISKYNINFYCSSFDINICKILDNCYFISSTIINMKV